MFCIHNNITKSKWSPQTPNEFDEISYFKSLFYREVNQLEMQPEIVINRL
jgi:hypothetical protein